MRRKKRYTISQIAMFVLVAMTFFCLYVGGNLQKEVSLMEADKNEYSLKSQSKMYITTNRIAKDLNFLECNQGNLKIQNIQCFRQADSNMCISTIYVNCNEQLKYPLISGNLIDDKDDKIVLLGCKLKEYTYTDGIEDYIMLDGERYRVIGYLGSKYSNILDYEIIFYNWRIGKNIKKKIINSLKSGLDVVIESDDFDSVTIKNNLLNRSSLINKDLLVDESSQVNVTETTSGETYIFIALIFCFVNTVIVSKIWLYERHQEIVIRYTFGYTKKQIYLVLLKELFMTCTGACLITYLFYNLLLLMIRNELVVRILNIRNMIWDFFLLFAGALFTGIVAFVYPLWKISKYSIKELQIRGGE